MHWLGIRGVIGTSSKSGYVCMWSRVKEWVVRVGMGRSFEQVTFLSEQD